jgi:DNA-3-methyladenine glycosylase I
MGENDTPIQTSGREGTRKCFGFDDRLCKLLNNGSEKIRCPWAETDPLLMNYHDEEWGVPVHRDDLLFEFLILEGAQAGLSWLTILRKRQNYRTAFDKFDPDKIARYKENRIRILMQNQGIIRNELKIRSAVKNAQSLQEVRREFGSFDSYIWTFVGGKPIRIAWKSQGEVPAKTKESDAMSKDLRKRGFSFVGSTICYSFMQAVGMANDHLTTCFRASQL